jgi:microcompartment protein CcmL/EutN
LIETVGLAGGIEAADAAVKSANVTLLGYELTKGDGMVTVKIEGDVGAVKAAVSAAVSAASKICRVVSSHVIPRPAAGLESLITSKDTVGYKKPTPKEPGFEKKSEPEPEKKPEQEPEKDPEPVKKPVPVEKPESESQKSPKNFEIPADPPVEISIEIPPEIPAQPPAEISPEVPEEPQITSSEELPKKKRRKRQKEETAENDEA